jgi:hypothetical protein
MFYMNDFNGPCLRPDPFLMAQEIRERFDNVPEAKLAVEQAADRLVSELMEVVT